MPYHIDEENSELAFEVREGNKLVIKIKSNIFSDSLELYLIKVGDNTEPTDKNVFSSLRVLKEIENLHDTILKEINSVTSGFWELKQDSQGNEYIATKYNVLTEGGLTTYGLGKQKLGTIYDGLPIDNDTIYWEEVEGSRVLKAKGSGGGSTGLDETKLWNVLGTPGDQQIDYSHLRSAFSQFSNDFVTINTEQKITALKHFTAGLSVGESKKKIYEKNGVVYIDADVAVTGAMTFYASAGRTVSTIMDAVTVDGITIKKENNVLKAIAGAGSSFDENAMWSALSGSSDNQINKSHLTTALDGYATQNWVIENYATKSELSAVSNKLNDFLEGSDADTIINKWKELEAFLSGMAETDNLAEILETKADKKYVDSTFVTLATKQTITGEKTFSSVLNTAAIKASGAITAPSLAVSDWVTIAGIKLRKLEDGALMLEGNLALTGALTMYASNGQGFDTIYDGLPIDNDTIYWQEVDGSRVLKAREGSGSSFDKSAMWTALEGATTEQINKTHLTTALNGYATESWVTSKNYLTSVSIATISDLHANWDALLKAAPSSYVTRWPTISEVTGRKNLIIKLNGGSTEGTNLFTYNVTGEKTINITPAGIGAAASSHNHSWSNITSGKPTTLAGYGITDAPTKTGSGASGTWGIGITGNAATASKWATARTITLGSYLSGSVSLDGSANVTLNANVLGLTSQGNKTAATGNTAPASGVRLYQVYNNGYPTTYGNLLSVKGGGAGELLLSWANANRIYYRSLRDNGDNWLGWNELAFITDNVASATKLQTARSLWGNNFDGTTDVTGRIIASNGIQLPYRGSIVTQFGNLLRTDYSEKDYNDFFELTARGASESSENKLLGGSSGLLTWSGNRFIFSSYGNGWYVEDNTWIRTYNSLYVPKNVQCKGNIECDNKVICTTLQAKELDIAYGTNYKFVRMGWNETSGDFASFYVPGSTSQWFRMELRSNGVLYTNGNILAEGGGTYYGSDIRYKSIMQQVKLSLLDIAEAPSFVYRWNKKGMKRNRLNLGGSAQYAQKILPWAVNDNDNFLSMDYATVAYTFAVHTARHLLTYESRTDKKIKKLEREIKILKRELKKLGYEEVRTLDDSGI